MAKEENTRAKYLITLAYEHQGGDARQMAINIMAKLREQLTTEQMVVVRNAIIDWTTAK